MGRLFAACGTTAAVTVALSGTFILTSVVFLTPKFFLFHFGALNTSFAHLFVVLDFCIRKLAVFSENNVEAEQKNANANKCDA